MKTRVWGCRGSIAAPGPETLRYGAGTREIVGVAADARDYAYDRPPTPTLYHLWRERLAGVK